jgi:hypothetical protein
MVVLEAKTVAKASTTRATNPANTATHWVMVTDLVMRRTMQKSSEHKFNSSDTLHNTASLRV